MSWVSRSPFHRIRLKPGERRGGAGVSVEFGGATSSIPSARRCVEWVSGKTISVHLPPPRIVDKYLDEKLTEVSTRETGWFVFHRKDLETEARQKALDGLVTAARVGGIDREAELQAKTLIGQFFQGLGYEKVEYR